MLQPRCDYLFIFLIFVFLANAYFCIKIYEHLSVLQNPSTGGRLQQSLVSAFIALTMKLNENLFKPLFLKIAEICTTATEEKLSAFTSQTLSHVFACIVKSLSQRLKAIFVPYLANVWEWTIREIKMVDFNFFPP
jgi:hypothetical protein